MFHIAFNTDENYVKYLAVLMTSIIKNVKVDKNFKDFCAQKGFEPFENSTCDAYENLDFNTLSPDEKEEGFSFHILSTFISEQNKNKLKSLESKLNAIYPCKIHIHLMSDSAFRSSKKWAHHKNYATYLRLHLFSVLKQDVKYCLYLDVDMLVVCDVRELFAINLKDKFAAVVLDCSNAYAKKEWKARARNEKALLLKKPQAYFNAGFILFNVKECQKYEIQKRFFNFLEHYHTKRGDQDVLNVAFEDNTLKLLPKWNLFILHFTARAQGLKKKFKNEDKKKCLFGYTKKDYQRSLRDAKIIHYTYGNVKPWESYYQKLGMNFKPMTYPYYDKWWDMALKTPCFSEEFKHLQQEYKENEFEYYVDTLGKRLAQMDRRLRFLESRQSPSFYDAVYRVKNQLSYKLGNALVKANSTQKILKLPFELLKIILAHKKQQRLYKLNVAYNPSLKLAPLCKYPNYKEALTLKKHLSYKLGQALIKNPLSFAFKIRGIYKEFKKSKNKK